MKILQVLVLIFGLSVFANAQACGYTFLTICLKDSEGKPIENAQIKTFDKDFHKEDSLDYPKNKPNYDHLRKNISWSDEKQAYFGSEGMCGGHKDVGLRISAVGFETFDKIIDLPLGWTNYSIKLKRKGTNDITEAVKPTKVFGKILDLADAGIPKAKVSLFVKEDKVSDTFTDSGGNYVLFLPIGQYHLEISADGFSKSIVENFGVLDNKNIKMDLILEVGNLTKHPPITDNKK